MASVPPDDEDYASQDDSDFAPDEVQVERASSTESDDDSEAGATVTAGKRRRRLEVGGPNGAELENSGDEAVISKGTRRRKKAKEAADDDEGGEGGQIKTRSQRAQEKAERKTASSKGPVTIDVDAMWARMTAGPKPSSTAPEQDDVEETQGATDAGEATASPTNDDGRKSNPSKTVDSDMVKIKRTYNFAGQVHTEEKLVARDSAEAKLYLASLGENAAASDQADDGQQKRMPRKAFRSIFEPIIDQSPQRADLNLGIGVRLKARELAKEDAKKLNTVEKSRMDWAGYVDKEGIKDELELAGKSKHSFAERQQFLARSEAKRDEDERRLRLAGKV